MSLSSLLPQPKQSYKQDEDHPLFQKQSTNTTTTTTVNNSNKKNNVIIPPYGQRKGYHPKNIEDFGDGGAFPEIHIAQYPLNMGRKKATTNASGNLLANAKKTTSTDIVVAKVDEQGLIKYDSVLGIDKNKIVYSQYKDLIPTQFTQTQLERPSEEDTEEVTKKTKEALEKIVNKKISVAQPKGYVDKQGSVSYVKYTPSYQGGGSGESRVIRMVEKAQDPLEPPKFKLKKQANRPRSPPPPIMHSPERKMSQAELDEWKIPPCISNWVNNGGFTIALDKRLVADGRNLQRPEINDKFAHLSQALYIAENKSREEVTARAELEKKLAQKEKERKQDMLRKLAEDVRNERSSTSYQGSSRNYQHDDESDQELENIQVKKERDDSSNGGRDRRHYDDDEDDRRRDHHGDRDRDYRGGREYGREERDNRRGGDRDNRDHRDERDNRRGYGGSRDERSEREEEYKRRNRRDDNSDDEGSSGDDSKLSEKEKRERDRIRLEKKREREREYRLEASGKKSKMTRDQDRDISEKIALGQVTGVRSEESYFDQRLFNQSEGMSSGFNGGDDESYNIYDKPLFNDRVASSIYRPRGGSSMDDDGEASIEDTLKTARFKPHKEFSGTDSSKVRSGPVMFELEKNQKKSKEEDPFGMDEFLSQAKKGKK